MSKIINKEKVVRKVFWLPPSLIKRMAREMKEKKLWPNDSQLAQHIISKWFQK